MVETAKKGSGVPVIKEARDDDGHPALSVAVPQDRSGNTRGLTAPAIPTIERPAVGPTVTTKKQDPSIAQGKEKGQEGKEAPTGNVPFGRSDRVGGGVVIPQTYKISEDTALRLAQLKKTYGRSSGKTTWKEFFAHVVEKLGGTEPTAPVDDSAAWPNGRVLTPRQQKIAEATIITYHSYLMASPSFKAAWKAATAAPVGPERARLVDQVLDDYRNGEIGQEVDVGNVVNRAELRRIHKEELLQRQAVAGWGDKGQSGPLHDAHRRSLDPSNMSQIPTFGEGVELAGLDEHKAIEAADPKRLAPPAKVPRRADDDPND